MRNNRTCNLLENNMNNCLSQTFDVVANTQEHSFREKGFGSFDLRSEVSVHHNREDTVESSITHHESSEAF